MTRLLSHPTFKNMNYRANDTILSPNVTEQKLEDGNIFPRLPRFQSSSLAKVLCY